MKTGHKHTIIDSCDVGWPVKVKRVKTENRGKFDAKCKKTVFSM